MSQHPYRSRQHKGVRRTVLITTGIVLVLLSGLLSMLVLTHHIDGTLAASSRPTSVAANAHGAGTVAVTFTYATTPTQAAAPTQATTPTQAAASTQATTPTQAATPTPTPIQANAELIPVQVRAYTIEGKMADGKMAHSGACAVSPGQFPLGTVLYLYNKVDKTFNRKCTAEDTGSDVQDGQIDLAMPGDTDGAMQWGTKDLLARVARRGWGDGNTTLPTP